MSRFEFVKSFIVFALLIVLAVGPACRAADSDDAKTLAEIQRELKTLEQDRAREAREFREERNHDRQVIRVLEIKVQRLEATDAKGPVTTEQLLKTDQNLQATTLQLQKTNDQVKTLAAKVDTPIPPSQFAGDFGRYLGSHTFQITGAAGIDFVYDQQSGALDGLHHATQKTFFSILSRCSCTALPTGSCSRANLKEVSVGPAPQST